MAPTPSVLRYHRRVPADVWLVSLLLNQQVNVQLFTNTAQRRHRLVGLQRRSRDVCRANEIRGRAAASDGSG